MSHEQQKLITNSQTCSYGEGLLREKHANSEQNKLRDVPGRNDKMKQIFVDERTMWLWVLPW